ncbi:unnamed protein product, partial [Hapterophycus canaliculatus]
SLSGAEHLPPVAPAEGSRVEATLARPQRWHTRSESGSSSGRRTPAAVGFSSASNDGIAAATRRAESAARRAEASARRAERSAKSARAGREGAEAAAGEAGSAAAKAKEAKAAAATVAHEAKVAAAAADAAAAANVAAPRHGSFGGGKELRPPRPTPPPGRQPLGSSSNRRSPPLGDPEATGRARERSSKADSDRAARLAERASMTARLEALAAATEAERRGTAGHRGHICTPWDTATTMAGTSATAGDHRRRKGDGEERSHGEGGLEKGDGTGYRRQPETAAVPPVSGVGIGRASKTVAGRERASSGAQDVDYWNRPVALAAAAAAAVAVAASPKASPGGSSSAGAERDPFMASEEGSYTRNGSAARGTDPRAKEDGAAGRLGLTSKNFARSHGEAPESFLSEASSLGTGLERVAEVEAAPASQEASRRRRRVLEHVEVGRGGQEHYRDAAKRHTGPVSFGSGAGFDADGGGAWGGDRDNDTVDDGDEERCSSQQRGTDFRVPPGGGSVREGKAAAVSGGVEGSAGPKKRATKKRKNRPATVAAA